MPLEALCAALGQPAWLCHLPEYLLRSLQDIRIRRGRAVSLVCGGSIYFPQKGGSLSATPGPAPVLYTAAEMDDLLCTLCGGAVYAHEEELRCGYISLPGGHRAGVCGTAVTEEASVRSVRSVTSLVIRVARSVPGCSETLLRVLGEEWRRGVLLVGEPSSGKTTVLRDLACTLTDGRQKHPVRTVVLDERGEFSSLLQDVNCTAEVLTGYPKAEGIVRAIRYLAPELLICDEIAAEEELNALSLAAGAGVAVAASMHAGSPKELLRRPLWQQTRPLGIFSMVAYLAGKERPGELQLVQKEENDEVVWHSADPFGKYSLGYGTVQPSAAACG